MDIEKIYEYINKIQNDLTFDEISRLYREIIYEKYESFTDKECQKIHCYQLLRGTIDIFMQMVNGREFDEDYLKSAIKW